MLNAVKIVDLALYHAVFRFKDLNASPALIKKAEDALALVPNIDEYGALNMPGGFMQAYNELLAEWDLHNDEERQKHLHFFRTGTRAAIETLCTLIY
jgi:hypothetical protein